VNHQFETAWRLHLFLTARRIPYALIGGLAVQRWGQLALEVSLGHRPGR
jgi:hypothetical protein